MDAASTALLAAGLIFPLLSALTGAASWIASRRDRRVSPVFVPLIGPVLLDVWLFQRGVSPWLFVIPWLADVGTLGFLSAAPWLVRTWWGISRFTRIGLLKGSRDIAEVTISLHNTHRYRLRKRWHRRANELGVVGIGEVGTCRWQGSDLHLVYEDGFLRRLRPVEGGFCVEEDNEFGDASLRGWVLKGHAEPIAAADERKDVRG